MQGKSLPLTCVQKIKNSILNQTRQLNMTSWMYTQNGQLLSFTIWSACVLCIPSIADCTLCSLKCFKVLSQFVIFLWHVTLWLSVQWPRTQFVRHSTRAVECIRCSYWDHRFSSDSSKLLWIPQSQLFTQFTSDSRSSSWQVCHNCHVSLSRTV